MTLDEAKSLKPGDIILWKGKTLRTVLSCNPPFINLKILKRSWTNRFYTTYLITAIYKDITLIHRPEVPSVYIDMFSEECDPEPHGRHLYDHNGDPL